MSCPEIHFSDYSVLDGTFFPTGKIERHTTKYIFKFVGIGQVFTKSSRSYHKSGHIALQLYDILAF